MLLCYLLNPLVILFVKNDGTLPSLLRWFETQDAPHLFFDGTGEIQSDWLDNHWLFLKKLEKYPRLHLYLCRLLWLYRNTGYGFAYEICGVDYSPSETQFLTYSDNKQSIQIGINKNSFKFTITKVYPFCSSLSLDIYIGWKLSQTGEKQRAMYAMNINPFKGGFL